MLELTHAERLDRLEKLVQFTAEDQLSLQKLIAQLATETRVGFDRVAKQAEETERRFKETDERINKRVSAMGEFIRRQDNSRS